MDAGKSEIFAFQLVKSLLQTITQLIQKTVLGIQFWSVKCMTATVRYAKISRIFIPSHQAFSSSNASGKAIATVRLYVYENEPLQNAFNRL